MSYETILDISYMICIHSIHILLQLFSYNNSLLFGLYLYMYIPNILNIIPLTDYFKHRVLFPAEYPITLALQNISGCFPLNSL